MKPAPAHHGPDFPPSHQRHAPPQAARVRLPPSNQETPVPGEWLVSAGLPGVVRRRHWPGKRALLWALVGAFLSLQACGQADHPQGGRAGSPPAACGQAQAEAIQLETQSKLDEALDRHGEALQLCRDSGEAMDRELLSISAMAGKSPGLCRKAEELFRGVPPSDRIDTLRARAAMSYFCPGGGAAQPDFSRLAEVEGRLLYGDKGPMLRELIVQYESAFLYFRANKPAEHLQALRAATREICREGVVPLVIRGAERRDVSEATPAGTLGLWILQPSGALDTEMRACLARIAPEVEAALGTSSEETQRDLKQWLDWYQRNVTKP
jgi:hypothetical protein